MACAARSSYSPDYVVDGITGLLASSDDQLSEALSRLICDPEMTAQMSAAAIRHAEKFDWDGITKQWEELLERAVLNRENRRMKKRVS
jgi:glycosyltransferase involved in cell wall biosynthesis